MNSKKDNTMIAKESTKDKNEFKVIDIFPEHSSYNDVQSSIRDIGKILNGIKKRQQDERNIS